MYIWKYFIYFSASRTVLNLWFVSTVQLATSNNCLLQFFVLDVYNSDGTPLTVDQIYIQLEKIWSSSLQSNKEPIGILTSNHRNSWGKAYNNLIKGGQC